jgi:anhydro-N-acetylmuramic acid kinase
MRVMGLMSGTSMDGIDSAVVEIRAGGETLECRVLHTGSAPYPVELKARLLAALPPAPTSMAEVCALDTMIGQSFADAAAEAVSLVGAVDLVVSHGQTVFHWASQGRVHGTLQLGQPAWIAERVGVPVVSDLRARDVAAGGQGAPLVSFFDALLLRGRAGRHAALNLGGIANITLVDEPALAFDTGPANALLDAAVFAAIGEPCDVDGKLASRGSVDEGLLADLLSDPYYRLPAPKSTGKEYFHAGYLDDHVRAYAARHGYEPDLPDLLATLCALTAETVADQVAPHGVEHLLVSGGGARNPVLMAMLGERLPATRLMPSDEYGVPGDAKEAVAFAVLGWHTCLGSITATTYSSSAPNSSSAHAVPIQAPSKVRFVSA